MVIERKEGCSICSVIETEVRLEDWVWRSWGQRCSSFSFSVSLSCTTGIFIGSICECWRLEYWNELEEESMGEDVCEPLEIRSESKGESQQVCYCRALDETGGVDLKEQKERCRSALILVIALVGVALGLEEDICLG